MPWKQVSAMDQREEFVRLALLEGANRRELCRRFGISRPSGEQGPTSYDHCRTDQEF